MILTCAKKIGLHGLLNGNAVNFHGRNGLGPLHVPLIWPLKVEINGNFESFLVVSFKTFRAPVNQVLLFYRFISSACLLYKPLPSKRAPFANCHLTCSLLTNTTRRAIIQGTAIKASTGLRGQVSEGSLTSGHLLVYTGFTLCPPYNPIPYYTLITMCTHRPVHTPNPIRNPVSQTCLFTPCWHCQKGPKWFKHTATWCTRPLPGVTFRHTPCQLKAYIKRGPEMLNHHNQDQWDKGPSFQKKQPQLFPD